MDGSSPRSFLLPPSPLPSPSVSKSAPRVSETNMLPYVAHESSELWDWDELLDFTGDDVEFPISLDSSSRTFPENSSESWDKSSQQVSQLSPGEYDRIRKRDPRLTCNNFLAGRIPCACPEIDAMMREEEESAPDKKRPRIIRIVRCQVQGCEADITELKGYHRRHRVCLHCANASVVLFNGQSRRYCQQCGKFHVLLDFDEGKRSCRRKLERHNNRRRRRKPYDSNNSLNSFENISQAETSTIDDAFHIEAGKEIPGLNRMVHVPENTMNEDFVSFDASGDAQIDGGNNTISSVHSENKSAYLSVCPTGRISFKLYDWNPAEFPRRLRHQIFQWLADMPVELEGYIRPGCTILTAFIAMPTLMWVKLYDDPALYLHDIIGAPRGVFFEKGRIFIYLEDMVFYAEEGNTSIIKMDVGMQPPKLHYVEPLCFEAGRSIEFLACGSNLWQTKFRFLISFSGKYLAYDNCSAQHAGCTLQNQLYKICIPHTEPNCFGPAFIEVENEFGLSNFLPILIANEGICSEVKRLQQALEGSAETSLLISDIAWLVRKPSPQTDITGHRSSSQVQRFSLVLKYLLENDCVAILARILQYVEIMIHDPEWNDINNAEIISFQAIINCAKDTVQREESQKTRSYDLVQIKNQVSKTEVPLLYKQVVMNFKEQPRRCSYLRVFAKVRPLAVIATAVICFTVCALIYHPKRVGKFVAQCFFDP